MRLAILIPCYNRVKTTLRCIEQIFSVLTIPVSKFDVIVVDDGSPDMTGKIVKEHYPNTIILYGDGNLWWGGSVNMGFEYALANGYDAVYLTNDDVDFAPQTVSSLIEHHRCFSSKNEILGSVIVDNLTKSVLSTGVGLRGKLNHQFHQNSGKSIDELGSDPIQAQMLSGKSMFLTIKILKNVGSINVKKFPHNSSDFDFTYRATASGVKCIVITNSIIYTDINQNYIEKFYFTSSKIEFLQSLFMVRYGHNLKNIFYASFIARRFHIGLYCYFRSLLKISLLATRKILFD